jgi:hypothetical protein
VATHTFHLFWTFLPEAMDALDDIGRYIHRRTATNSAATADHG